jgi:hypothetical protein
MKKIVNIALAFGFAAAATAASAQTAPAPAAPAAPSASAPAPAAPAAAGPVTDTEVKQFATALVAINDVQKNPALSPTDKQTAMVAKVQEQGLQPQRFNEIAQASQTDTALQGKVQTELAKQQPAAAAAAPAAPAQ